MSRIGSGYSNVLRKGGQSQAGVVYGKRVRVSAGKTPFSTRQERWYRRTQGPVDFIKLDPQTGSFVLSKTARQASFRELYNKNLKRSENNWLSRFLRKRGIINPQSARGRSRAGQKKQSSLFGKLRKAKNNKSFSSALSGYTKGVNKQRFGSQAKGLGRGGPTLKSLFKTSTVSSKGSGYRGGPGVNPGFGASRTSSSTRTTTTGSSRTGGAPRTTGASGRIGGTSTRTTGASRTTSGRARTVTTTRTVTTKPRTGSARKAAGGGKGARKTDRTATTRKGKGKGGKPRSASGRKGLGGGGKRGRKKDPNAVRNQRVHGDESAYGPEERRQAYYKGKNKPAAMKALKKKPTKLKGI